MSLPALAPSEFSSLTLRQLVSALPAAHRAQLAWAPARLRLDFFDPLFALKSTGELEASLTELRSAYGRLSLDLGAGLAKLASEPRATAALTSVLEGASDGQFALISSRVEPLDELAADYLRETLSISRAVQPVFLAALESTDLAALDITAQGAVSQFPEEWTAATTMGAFLTACLEWAQEEEHLHPLFRTWARLSSEAAHATLRFLRRDGIPVAQPPIPGFTRREWRRRWAARVLDEMTEPQLEEFERSLGRSDSRSVLGS